MSHRAAFPDNDWDGHFVVCSNCQRAFDASWYNDNLRNVVKLVERIGERDATEYVEVEAVCPHCYHKRIYIGGDENKWREIHFTNAPNVREEVFQAEADALRMKLIEIQRQSLTLQEQVQDVRKQLKALRTDKVNLGETLGKRERDLNEAEAEIGRLQGRVKFLEETLTRSGISFGGVQSSVP